MNFGVSKPYTFEKKMYINDGFFMLQIKIPHIIKNFYYQMVGSEHYFYTGQSLHFFDIKENKKDEKINHPFNYLLFAIPTIQELFFQIRIVQNEKLIEYHDFIDMNELFKDIQIPTIKKNIKMTMVEFVKEEDSELKKEDDKKEEDVNEEEEDDNDDEEEEEEEDDED